MAYEDLIPVQPGEIKNPYGRAGKPELREAREEKRLKEKIITAAIKKELNRKLEDGSTVLDKLVKNAVRQAETNDRYFDKLLDRIDGPVKQDMNISSDTGLGVVILPAKVIETEE